MKRYSIKLGLALLGLLLTSLLVTPTATADEAATQAAQEAIAKAVEGYTAMSADMTTMIGLMGQTIELKGTTTAMKPKYMKLKMEAVDDGGAGGPMGGMGAMLTSEVTNDGETIWIYMPAMNMGRNRVSLKLNDKDVYQGFGVIVRCKSGHRTWRATVDFPGIGKADFIFDVIY